MGARRFLSRDAWFDAVQKGAPRDTLLRKFTEFPAALTKGIDAENRTVPLVISTEAEDRSHDIVYQDGWDLTDFLANPVITFGHDHHGFPVGQAVDTAVVGKRLLALGKFATREESPAADTTFKLIAGRYLRGVSPGYKPTRWDFNQKRGGCDYFEQKLYEAAIVTLPDNQEALVLAKSAGIDLRPLRIHAEKALDEWPVDAPPPMIGKGWFETVLQLAPEQKKGRRMETPQRKSVHVGAALTKALAAKVTDTTPRDTFIAKMAEGAGLDVAAVESVLAGEGPAPALAALEALATPIAAPLDDVIRAAAQDVTPVDAAQKPQPDADEDADADDVTEEEETGDEPPETEKSMGKLVAAVTANTNVQKQILAELKTRKVAPKPPPPDAGFDFDSLAEKDVEDFFEKIGTRIDASVKKTTDAALTALTGRLPG